MDTQRSARIGGRLALTAGVLGVGIGALLLLAPPAVPVEHFNYPLGPGAFVTVQILQFVHHLLMAAALSFYFAAGLAGKGRLAWFATVWVVVALVFLAVWELFAIAGVGLPYPAEETAWLDIGYSVGNAGSGIGLVLLGIASVRAHVLSGVSRWIVLITGGYMFVPMAPALLAGFVVGRLVLMVWLLLFAAVGWAMLSWASDQRHNIPAAPHARAAEGMGS